MEEFCFCGLKFTFLATDGFFFNFFFTSRGGRLGQESSLVSLDGGDRLIGDVGPFSTSSDDSD